MGTDRQTDRQTHPAKSRERADPSYTIERKARPHSLEKKSEITHKNTNVKKGQVPI
jgi:hypothetical protein